MPNFVAPLLPTFGAPKDAEKMIKKAEQVAIGYGIGITIAKAIPATAGPIGFALGLNILPGKGIRIKPASLLLLHAPQPIGVMPPHYYHLPDLMAEPVDLAQIMLKKNRRELLDQRIEADYVKRGIEQRLAAEQRVRELTQFERDTFDALAARQVPRKPTVEELFAFGKITQLERIKASLQAGATPIVTVVQDGQVKFIDFTTGQVLLTSPFAPTDMQASQILAQIQALPEFARLNPPDP